MARFHDFPPEVLEEIMSWLPSESLRWFKLVQKSLYTLINALIKDPVFVAKHQRNMKIKLLTARCHRFTDIFVEEEEEKEGELKEKDKVETEDREKTAIVYESFLLTLANGDWDGQDYIRCDTDDMKHLVTFMDDFYFKVLNHCNGIICVSNLSMGIIFLLNPGVREMRTVRSSCYSNDYELRATGFGYDSRANDYKVVALIALPINEDVDGPFKAEVYSLSTSSWKEIKLDVEIYDIKGLHQQVYCNGVCYWYYWDWTMLIHSFDFNDEVFRDVPMPKGKWEVAGWDDLADWTKISVWNESVVLFFYPEKGPKVIDMWVLDSKSGGVEGSYSWTKHLTIGPVEDIKWPLAFWDKDELFLEAKNGKIKFYHLVYEIFSHISFRLQQLRHDRFLIYEESLVSVLGTGRRTVAM